jgi:hypothetical protein
LGQLQRIIERFTQKIASKLSGNEEIKRNILQTLFFSLGISTESGIPDYRSEGVGLYATSRYGNLSSFFFPFLCFFPFFRTKKFKKIKIRVANPRHFTAEQIRIRPFTLMRIRVLLIIKVMATRDHWSTDPSGFHFEPPRLHL